MKNSYIAIIALLLGVLFVNACRIEPSSLRGDLTSVDMAMTFPGRGQISLPQTSFGGSGFSFVMDVFANEKDFTGCLYSAGTPGKRDYVDIRFNANQLQLTVGDEVASTFRILDQYLGKWINVVLTVDFSTSTPGVRAYINGLEHQVQSQITKKMPISKRTGFLGFCYSDNLRLNAVIDNVMIFNDVKTESDAEWFAVQFFPLVRSDNLVLYLPFNDVAEGADGHTVGHAGSIADSFIKGEILDGPTGSLKAATAPKDVVDAIFGYTGITKEGETDPAKMLPPFFGSDKGGATQSVACQDGDQTLFTINQFWTSEGGIRQMTIKTSNLHYWRVSAGGLQVEHRTWGGWNVLPRGSDTIQFDQTTYMFSDNAVLFQAGKFGFVKITENNGRLSYEAGVNTAACPVVGQPVRGAWGEHLAIEEFIFDFSTEPVPEMPFGRKSTEPGVGGTPSVLACPPPSQVYRPDHMTPPPPPPPPPPPRLPPPPPPKVVVDPCASWKNGDATQKARYEEFAASCGKRFTAQPPSSSYKKCLVDSCVTGTTTTEQPDCSAQLLKAATIPGFQVDPKCETDSCPNQCSGNGVCQKNVCICDAGFTGRDCAFESDYPCFRASAVGSSVPVKPAILTDSKGVRVGSAAVDSDSFVVNRMKEHAVEDSAVVYLASTRGAGGKTEYHLAVMNNNGNGAANGGGYTMTISNAGSATAYTWGENGATASASKSGSDHVVQFSWTFNGQTGLLLKNIPDTTETAPLTITVSSKTGVVTQILVGSAHGANAASGVLSVFKQTQETFTIWGKTCTNECEALATCDACSASQKCGWCAETSRCMPGDSAGPVYYGSCANWRYSFDTDVSRRLTQEYAFPVSPGYTDVFLASAVAGSDIPIEVNVNVQDPKKIQWDLVFLNQWDAGHKSTWKNVISDVLSVLRTYPNLGVGMNRHTSNGYEIIKALSNPRDLYWFEQHVNQAPARDVATLDLQNAIQKLSTTASNPIGWRQGARKILLITADKGFSTVNTDALRKALLSRDIIPVFVVTGSVRAQYQALVKDLGFGFVESLTARSGNIRQATVRAIQLVSGHASTHYSAAGHVDTAMWSNHLGSFTMYGLNTKFVARFAIPVHGDSANTIASTELHMPAFGNAKIINVETDKPSAQALPARSSGFEGEDQIIQLQGRSFRNVLQVTPEIMVLPTVGKLYQVQTITRDGKPVSVAADEIVASADGRYMVSDPMGRVAYRSPVGQHGADFDSFTFVIFDGCIASDAITVPIDVFNKNTAPVAEIVPPTGDEDTVQVLYLKAFDNDGDKYQAFITEPLHGMSEDGSMFMDDNLGDLFQYTDDSFVTSRTNALANGKRIEFNANKDPILIEDRDHRVIYWPKPHRNSYASLAKTPELLVKPCINYKVTETDTVEKLSSDETRVPIDIREVNDAPLIWGDTSADAPDWTYTWPAVPASVGCYQDCQFEEDFGERYPWDAGFKYIFLGGGDVEKSQLTFVLTNIDCPSDVILQNDLIGDRNVAAGDELIDNDPDAFHPLLRFRPGPDGNDDNSGKNGYYCKISYKIKDTDGAISEKVHTITISVTPIDDPPRLRTRNTLVTALERTPKSFSIDAVVPDNSGFKVSVVNCRERGLFEVCVDAACVQTETIDCANLPTGGQVLPAQSARANRGAGFGYNMIFTSGRIRSLSDGLNYNFLRLQFLDQNNQPIGDQFTVNVNVISLNKAPVITVNNLTDPEMTISVNNRFAPSISVYDEDVANGDLTVTITMTPVDAADTEGRMQIDDSVFTPGAVAKYDQAKEIVFDGKLSQVNAALQKFVATGSAFGKYEIVITVNDNGYFGQCEANDGSLVYTGELCPLEDTVTIHVEFVDQQIVDIAIISGAGVGVLGLTIAGAVAATRFFNSKAANGEYAPWDAFDADGAAVSNPLYESSTIGGENRIYQDAADGGEYQKYGSDRYL